MENVPENPGRPQLEVPPTAPVSDAPIGTVPEWLAARRTRPVRSTGSPKPKTIPLPVDSLPPNGRHVGVVATPPSRPIDSAPDRHRESWSLGLVRWPKRAAVFGISTSLALHLALLMSLAVFVIRGRAVAPPNTISVEFGHPGGDTIIDPDLEASLQMEGGHEAAPLQIADLNQPPSFDAISFNPGEVLNGVVNGIGTGDGRGTGDGTGGGTDTGIGIPAVNVPSFAVTKGSFSAWTEPRDPDPNRQYVIVIQVRLPKAVREYRGSDLTGMVTGTDLYRQPIKFKTTDKFPVTDGAVEVRVPVPGAAKLVRDTIRIESRLLREKQTLKIEF
ncbi:MAG: hypothetical protein AABP62_24790 [Planctomycetota bacterium]